MTDIRQYLLTVIAAAIICAGVRVLARKKGASSVIINLVSAVFLVITVVSPWANWSFADIAEYANDYSEYADTIVDGGVSVAQAETASIIRQETEAYIVNKAESLGADVRATVTLTEDIPMRPQFVQITGNISPYLRQRLSQIITSDLGIPEANQIWN